jgi:UDP-GlcNAc:undecaprenyl-phosphate GlcNAc-1-phosphate transferase
MIFLTTLLLSVFITISLIPILTRVSLKINLVDFPDSRKVHTSPMPKSGGIAMAIGALIPVIIWTSQESFVKWYLIGSTVILISALIDDIKGHGPWTKFLSQVIAALIIILPGSLKIENLGMLLPDGFLLPVWISIPLTLIAIVGVTNAINLSDGLDGLAGGICLLSFSCLGYIAYLSGNEQIALISVALAGAIFGFLRFNTYPASIFMGDTGSQFLGFSAIVLSVKLTQCETPLSPLLPIIILGFPVLDTIAVMSQRYQEGRPIFRADKNHFHHKLMRLGFYHNESVIIIYMIQSGLVITALF